MNTQRIKFLLVATVHFLTVYSNPSVAAEVYRWVDKNGAIYYSDQVPPKHSRYGRSKLKKSGMKVKVYDGAKTKEQLEQEKALKKLHEEKQRLLTEQRARDQSLLRTFRDEQEIRMTLSSKLRTIEGFINITESNIEQLRSRLAQQEKRAASVEKNGRKISKNLIAGISETRRRIQNNLEKLKHHKREAERLTEKYEKDIVRFNELTRHHSRNRLGKRDASVVAQPKDKAINSYVCSSNEICGSAWQLALNYVKNNATTRLSISNDKIIRTADPATDQDVSLSVFRISGEKNRNSQIFLDVRCKPTSIGKELCASQEIQKILHGFHSYIDEKLE